MIYQLRIFKDYPGRVDAHIERFRNHTCPLLEKHGAQIVGLWTCLDDEHKHQVVFMAAYQDMDAMRAATAAFAADPEQATMVADSEQDGRIIESRENLMLQPVDFSPLR
jgi:hypothetical protein